MARHKVAQKFLARFFLSLIIMMMLASPAQAQPKSDANVTYQLVTIDKNARGQGRMTIARSPIFRLNNQTGESIAVSLVRGKRYSIRAACDNDCTQLHIRLFNQQGRVISDTTSGTSPAIDHTAKTSGQYNVQIFMADCKREPCRAGLTLQEHTPFGRSQATYRTNDAHVARQLDVFEQGQVPATQLGSLPIVRLNEGARHDYDLDLIAGVAVKIGVVCDTNCRDIDAMLLDENNVIVRRDILPDSIPTLDYTPSASGKFKLRAIVYACSQPPCSAGAMVMRYRPRETASPPSDMPVANATVTVTVTTDMQNALQQLTDLQSNLAPKTPLYPAPILRPADFPKNYEYPVKLARGQRYEFIGRCDGCGIFDIEILSPDGTKVASYVSTGAQPKLSYAPDQDGTYTIQYTNTYCRIPQCLATVLVLSGGGVASSFSARNSATTRR